MMSLGLLLIAFILLLVLAVGALVSFRILKRRGFRFQYSLRSLFILTTVVALVLGLISYWPNHVATLHIPRVEFTPGHIHETRDAVSLEILQRWGRTTLRVTPRDGFGETSSAEVFWLDSGKVRHVALAEKGTLLTTAISVPTGWPLTIGVVEYHPEAILLVTRRFFADGMDRGGSNGTFDANDRYFDGGIEKWGKRCLEQTQR